MLGTDSPSSRSCCCRNILILPLFLRISNHPCPRPTPCPQKPGQLLHVTRGLWLPCLANERLTIQIPILFVSHYDRKKGRISPNFSTEHHQNHWYFKHHYKIGIYNWKWWPRLGRYNIGRDTTYTPPSTLLREAALPSDHSSSTTHLSVLAPVRICASQWRGEARHISMGSIVQDRDGMASTRNSSVPLLAHERGTDRRGVRTLRANKMTWHISQDMIRAVKIRYLSPARVM